MKRLIADVYIIMYRLTRTRNFSFAIALIYISLLNLISIYGLGLLLQGWMISKIIHKLFSFPWYVPTSVAMVLLNLWMMMPLKNLSKERNKTPYYPSILAYTLIIAILCVYIHYHDKLPN